MYPEKVSRFCIQIESIVTDCIYTVETEYRIWGLSPCNSYTLIVCTVDLEDKLGACADTDVETIEDNPSEVVDLRKLDNTESTATIIVWDPPTYATKCVDGYRYVIWLAAQNVEVEWNVVSETRAELNLAQCTQYKIQLIALTESRRVEGLPNSIIFSVDATIPGPVLDLRNETTTANEVTLIWSPPPSKEIACSISYKYLVKYNGNENKTTDNTSITITNLISCQKYLFVVCIVNFGFDERMCVSLHVTTGEEKPSKVKNIHVKEIRVVATLEWNLPDQGTLCIKDFQYSISEEDQTVDLPNGIVRVPEVEIPYLNVCVQYIIKITALTYGGIAGEEASYRFSIPNAGESGSVTNLTTEVKSPKRVTLNWKSPDSIDSKCIKGYRILANGENVEYLVDNLWYTVSGLEACNTYVFSVCTIFLDHIGDCVDSLSITMPEDIPGPVTQLQYLHLEQGQTIIQWEAPLDALLCVTSYFTQVVHVKTGEITTESEETKSELELHRLEACENYQIDVRVKTQKGLHGKSIFLPFPAAPKCKCR